jgi:hypothetical protein
MSDEALEVPAVDPAPEQVVTATPAPEETTPAEQTTEAAKTFTQEELDAIVGKRLAREQRKWEREQAQRLAELEASRKVASAPLPDVNDFDNAQAYAEALAERKAQELLAQREAAKQQAQLLDAYHEKEEDARGRYDDFEQVAYNPNLPVTDVMAQTIQASEIGPDVIYYLGSNPKEAGRIAAMPPILQAREIGKIEAKLASNPPVKKTSTAPAPIAPIAASRSTGAPAYDTTDPRSVKTMTTSEWIEAERLRQIKKWEAQHNR